MPTESGAQVVAITDVIEGESLRHDYRTLGPAPEWFVNMLREKTGNTECVFAGQNDYVAGEPYDKAF